MTSLTQTKMSFTSQPLSKETLSNLLVKKQILFGLSHSLTKKRNFAKRLSILIGIDKHTYDTYYGFLLPYEKKAEDKGIRCHKMFAVGKCTGMDLPSPLIILIYSFRRDPLQSRG